MNAIDDYELGGWKGSDGETDDLLLFFSGLSQNPSKRFLAMHAYLIIVSKQCFTILESHIITVSYILEKEIDILTGNLLHKVKIFIFLCNI